ncbi:MAG: 3-hydroxyacyl-CoA dehydrogenase family protein [Chloroflexi bacterium]|nr:3-hydroxyacyl-CoA dehydrogenase family protein [Chloroflexota bacterium]
MTEIKTVAVIGAGTMGNGIAQSCAMAGISVSMVDVEDRFVRRGVETITTSLARFVKSEKLTPAQSEAVLARIVPTTDFAAAVKDAEVVIEAVPEVMELKQDVFKRLVAGTRTETVLATNTSQFSISALAAATDRPESVIGMHFFNPPVLMKLVEIVRGVRTSDRTLDVAQTLTRQLGKESAVCKRDTVGFITSRALAALRLECIRIHEEGIASIEDIDRAIRLGLNHPMGPFELNDFNGLDTALFNTQSLREAYGDRFIPPQSLISRVRSGMLGRKAGRGWYDYSGDKPKPIE